MSNHLTRFYAFGPFLLDASERRLSRGGQAIQLTPRQFQLLWLFVQNRGHILTKDELIERLWPDTFVEEGTLTRSVSRLRELLAKDAESQYIETIPRQGYRFVANVAEVEAREDSAHESAISPRLIVEPANSDEPHDSPFEDSIPLSGRVFSQKVRQHRRSVAIAVAILILGSVTGALFASRLVRRGRVSITSAAENEASLNAKMVIIPFTTYPGLEGSPAFSPDGNQIAFIWDDHVYVKIVGTERPLRLTSESGSYRNPVWSPDGRYVAFIRNLGDYNVIIKIPALGGPEMQVARSGPDGWGMSWSPDGKTMVISDSESSEERYGLHLLSLDSGERRRLTRPVGAYDDLPAFSPDGQTIAFTRIAGTRTDLFIIAAEGGEPQKLTADDRLINGLTWTANGKEIVFSSDRAGPPSLWKIPVTGGAPERVAAAGQHARSPSISRAGNRLAYVEAFDDTNIWRIEIPAGQSAMDRAGSATQLIASTRFDHSPQISPDGKKIVFISNRSGRDAIWVCDSDGGNAVQLESDYRSGTPRWSPDGKYIAFDSGKDDGDIYVISAEGGMPRRLTTEPYRDILPGWSRDGRWLYFCSTRGGSREIWKMPADGGEFIQVTRNGGFEGFESPDGKSIYYTKGRSGGIYRLPVDGGEETEIPELNNAGRWRYWAVASEGIYFIAQIGNRWSINLLSFATGRVRTIAFRKEPPIEGPPGLAISPDGRWLLYTQSDRRVSDIFLVENFN